MKAVQSQQEQPGEAERTHTARTCAFQDHVKNDGLQPDEMAMAMRVAQEAV